MSRTDTRPSSESRFPNVSGSAGGKKVKRLVGFHSRIASGVSASCLTAAPPVSLWSFDWLSWRKVRRNSKPAISPIDSTILKRAHQAVLRSCPGPAASRQKKTSRTRTTREKPSALGVGYVQTIFSWRKGSAVGRLGDSFSFDFSSLAESNRHIRCIVYENNIQPNSVSKVNTKPNEDAHLSDPEL